MFKLNVNIYTSPTVGKTIVNALTGGNESVMIDSIMKSDAEIVKLPLEAAATAPKSPIITQLSIMLALVVGLGVASHQFLKSKVV